jgi:hypothetical protein
LERPDLWKVYLNEAEGIFRSRGFEGTLRRLELEEGTDVSLFILGFDADGAPSPAFVSTAPSRAVTKRRSSKRWRRRRRSASSTI